MTDYENRSGVFHLANTTIFSIFHWCYFLALVVVVVVGCYGDNDVPALLVVVAAAPENETIAFAAVHDEEWINSTTTAYRYVQNHPRNLEDNASETRISANEWIHISIAMNLSSILYNPEESQAVFNSSSDSSDNMYYYFNDAKNDAAVIDTNSINNTCIIVFRGTQDGFVPFDSLQNMRGRAQEFCSRNGELCCQAHTGFRNAYQAPYKSELETIIETQCIGKDLLFTGHSQGAGVAQIAALRFWKDRIRTKVYLFGSPAAYKEPCLTTFLDNDRLYRFHNTGVVKETRRFFSPPQITKIAYDFVTLQGYVFRPARIAGRVFGSAEGNVISLPPDLELGTTCAYFAAAAAAAAEGTTTSGPPPFDQTPFRYIPIQTDSTVHDFRSYQRKITAMLAFPAINLNGYESDIPCTLNGECNSGTCRAERSFLTGVIGTCA